MSCPNCNSNNISKLEKTSRIDRKSRGDDNPIFICLKCGLIFTKYIERRYATKNL
jgi:RNase P subunit RPR2